MPFARHSAPRGSKRGCEPDERVEVADGRRQPTPMRDP